MIRCVCALLVALVGAANVSAQTRVALRVSADDLLKNQITSYITRELRTIPDIVVVESKPDYEIQVVGIRDQLENGREVGQAMSVVIVNRLGDYLLESLRKIDNSTAQFAAIMLADYANIRVHRLLTGSRSILQEHCRTVVADFDAEHLEPARKFRQTIQDNVPKDK